MEPTRNSTIAHQAPPAAHKITLAFERARQEGRGALIPYFMCGYPSPEQSVRLTLAAIEGGADLIELGIPFSDPLADGVTIQHAGQVALQNGITIRECLHIAHQIAQQRDTPLVFMGYYNPILAYGIERFCADAQAAGISGLIIPDLPPEEAEPLQQAAQRNGLALIFLISPTTPDQRIPDIVELAAREPKGFIYCVSLSGVTGARKELPPHLQEFVQRVRGYTKNKGLLLAVGFGLSTPEHVARVTSYADGAVVASALVRLIDQHPEHEQAEAVKKRVRDLRSEG